MQSKAQSKLLMLMSVLSVGLGLSFFTLKYDSTQNVAKLFDEQVSIEKQHFEAISTNKSLSMDSLVHDYTFWDELLVFARTGKDHKWAAENLDTSLASYKMDVEWTYNAKLQKTHYSTIEPNAIFIDPPVLNKEFIAQLQKQKIVHYYYKTQDKVIEISASRIFPSNDPDRLTNGEGYFFVGRLLDEGYFSEIENLTGSIGKLLSIDNAGTDSSSLEKGMIVFDKSLEDWEHKSIAKIHVLHKATLFASLERSNNSSFALFVAYGIAILSLFYIFFLRWVGVPLNTVSQSLKEDSDDYLQDFITKKDEFGDIARLISRFFEQRSTLKKNISEMKAAEKLLQEKTQGLEKLNSLMINREIRMIEMKQQLKSFNSTAHMHTENETSKGDESTVG